MRDRDRKSFHCVCGWWVRTGRRLIDVSPEKGLETAVLVDNTYNHPSPPPLHIETRSVFNPSPYRGHCLLGDVCVSDFLSHRGHDSHD